MNNNYNKIDLGGTARSPEDLILLAKLGLNFAEIPVPDNNEILGLIDHYNELKNSLGLYYLCHGPREGKANDIEHLEKVYLKKIKALFPIMDQLDMRLLTIHLWMDHRFIKPDVLLFKRDLLKKIVEQASTRGISICLENLSENVSDIKTVMEEVPDLNLTLDLGHAQLLSDDNTSFGFIKNFPDRIMHVHLHDNRGGDSYLDDLHLPPGDGIIDLKGIFRDLIKTGYQGTITLELKPFEIQNCLGFVKELIN